MFKISFEPPKPKIVEEVALLFKKKARSGKKGELVEWSHKERLLVGLLLAATILLSFYFWYQGTGNFPKLNFGFLNFGETIILE